MYVYAVAATRACGSGGSWRCAAVPRAVTQSVTRGTAAKKKNARSMLRVKGKKSPQATVGGQRLHVCV